MLPSMKRVVYCLIIFLYSCSHISEDQRLIYVKPDAVNRSVLVEDFTGQLCLNCPRANDEISALQQEYGEDAVVAVAIHSGPLGFYSNALFLGLATETGDLYYDHWEIEYQPIGMIDRGECLNYTLWNARIREELQKVAPVGIKLDTNITDDSLAIVSDIWGVDGNFSGKYQLWIVEYSIIAFQKMPDGTRRDDYVHKHVFRTAVNGTWGEDINIKEGENIIIQHSIKLSEDWQIENVSVIGFVYDSRGVHQVSNKKTGK